MTLPSHQVHIYMPGFQDEYWTYLLDGLITLDNNAKADSNELKIFLSECYQSNEIQNIDSSQFSERTSYDLAAYKDRASSGVNYVIQAQIRQFHEGVLLIKGFLFVQSKISNSRLCIDLTGLRSESERNRILYGLNHFLWHFHDRGLFFSRHINFQNGEIKINEFVRVLRRSPSVLSRFTPLFEVTKGTYESLFQTSIAGVIQSHEISSATLIERILKLSKEDFPIHDLTDSAHHFLWRKVIDFFNLLKSNQIQGGLLSDFENESILSIYLTILFIDNHDELKILVYEPRAKYEDIKPYIELLKEYFVGLREIAENLVLHTEHRKGYFFIRMVDQLGFKSYSNLIPGFSQYRQDVMNADLNFSYFFQIELFDFSVVGIAETFQKTLPKHVTGMSAQKSALTSFFIGSADFSGSFDRLDFRHMARLGLRTFSKIIIENFGLLSVSSSSSSGVESFTTYKGMHPPLMYPGQRNGTYYFFLIPIVSKEFHGYSLIYESKSFYDYFRQWMKDDGAPKTRFIDSIPALREVSGKYLFIKEVGDKILSQTDPSVKALVFNFRYLTQQINDLTVVVKILAYIQLNQHFKYIIIQEADSKFISLLQKIIRVYFEKSGVIWNDGVYVYVYDDSGVPFIISGRGYDRFYAINQKVKGYYGKCHVPLHENDGTVSNPLTDSHGDVLFPFEILQDSLRLDIPTDFEKTVSRVVDSELETDHARIKISNTHMRIGSLIHIENFYEASFIFQNSYYVDRFSFLIGKQLLQVLNNTGRAENMLLLGYGEYSEMLLARIKYMFDSYDGLKHRIHDYFICKDRLQLGWDDETKFDDLKENINENTKIILLVPISSTLQTNKMVFNEFIKKIKQKLKVDLDEQAILFHSCIFLVRDRLSDECSEAERFVGWDSVNRTKREVCAVFFKRPIHYLIEKEGLWDLPLTCKRCFPDIYGTGSPLEEIGINETNEVSTISKTIFHQEEYPPIRHDRFLAERERLSFLSDTLKYGHIHGDSGHHDYYIDSREFFKSEQGVVALKQWFGKIKAEFQKDSASHNVILSIKNSTNSHFLNLAKDEIFDGVVSHINLDLSKNADNSHLVPHYSSFKGKSVKFHFFADVLSNGTSLEAAIEHLFPLRRKLSLNTSELFSSIVILVNRMDQNRISDIQKKYLSGSLRDSNIQSFINLYSPQIHTLQMPCFKCEEMTKSQWIYDHSVLQFVRIYFRSRINNLSLRSHLDVRKSQSNRFFDRLLISHEVAFALLEPGSSPFEKLQNQDRLYSTTLYRRINYYKVISTPPYSMRGDLRNFILKLLLTTANELTSMQSEIRFLHLNLLVVCLKRLAYFKSVYLIRKETIDSIWRFFSHFHSQFSFLTCFKGMPNDIVDAIFKLSVNGIKIEQIERDYKDSDAIGLGRKHEIASLGEIHKERLAAYFSTLSESRLFKIVDITYSVELSDLQFNTDLSNYVLASIDKYKSQSPGFTTLLEDCTEHNPIIKRKLLEIQQSRISLFLEQNFQVAQLRLLRIKLCLKVIYYMKDLGTTYQEFIDTKMIEDRRKALADERDQLTEKQKKDFFDLHPRTTVADHLSSYLPIAAQSFTREFINLEDDLALKSYHNFRDFEIIMVSTLKRVVSDDESKSFRYSYLTGYGKEFTERDVSNIQYRHNTYNSYFNYPTDLAMKEIKEQYFNFKVSINLENLYVHQRCFENMDREHSLMDVLSDGISARFPNYDKYSDNELSKFKYILATDPKYHYIKVLSGTSEMEKLFISFLLKKYMDHYNFFKPVGVIENFLQTILRFLSDVMDADFIFLAIRKFKHSNSKNLYVISRYSAIEDKDTKMDVPFELDSDSSFTYKYVNDESSLKTFEIVDYDRKSGRYIESISADGCDLLGLNLFLPEVFHSPGLSRMGGITFVHKIDPKLGTERQKQLRAERKESLKFVLLIINELRVFLEREFDNENFSNWIEIAKTNRVYEIRNNKFRHNARAHSVSLVGKTESNSEFNCYARLINSDLFIGDQFSRYVSQNTLKKSTKREIQIKQSIWQMQFIKLLQHLPKIKGLQNPVVVEELKAGGDAFVHVVSDDIKDILVLLVGNALSHGLPNKAIVIGYDAPYLKIKNSVDPVVITPEKFKKINEATFDTKCLSGGITLFTLEKYFQSNYNKPIVLELDNTNVDESVFIIKIPLNS